MTAVFLFILGLLVGSFVNVLIDRLPRGESVVLGRSRCDYCKKTLRWYELVPVASYIVQSGRCRRCHKRLSVQYPVIELVTGIGFAGLFLMDGTNVMLTVSLYLLFTAFLVMFVADLMYQIIPDSMIVLAGAGTILYLIARHATAQVWLSQALTGLVCLAVFYCMWLVTRGKGLGFGDVKFAPLMGLLLGFPGAVMAFYVAFLTGALVGVILMLGRKKTWKSKIAFGPFLVLGTVVAWVWQGQLTALWRMFV